MSSNQYFLESYKVLYQVFKHKAYSTIELNSALQNLEVPGDRALVTKIVYGVLENNIQLEYIIGQFAAKKPKLPTFLLLKIGTYAILHLNSIPSYAIVNELVELTKSQSKQQEAGFVNKVLKNIIEKKYELPKVQNTFEYLSIKYSYPIWLLKKLQKQYGKEVLEQLIQNRQSKLKHLRLNLQKTNIADFKKLLDEHQIAHKASIYDDALFADYAKLQKITTLKPFYTVQSLGSMFIIKVVQSKQDDQILDTCAAPGGKACYMAQLASEGSVLAGDIHPHRVELIKKYAGSMGITNLSAQIIDATVLNKDLVDKFDAVLCDAPCSGVGVINKKPDILLFKEEDSITPLSKLQHSILQTASNYVKQGGHLVYSTCTLLKEENIQVVEAFLEKNPQFALVPIETPKLNHIKEKHTITLLPDEQNFEGYFVAKMQKL